jgi:AbrB family looped-hinge helix DNA binding protein
MERFTVAVDGSGRILIPAKVRRQLKLQQGSALIVRVDQEKLVLETRARALREAQAYFSKFRPKGGKLMSEELIEERREEARRELED